MHYLLSLPPNLVNHFHALTGVNDREWFCTSDPVGSRLGSGGGTVWLLRQFAASEGVDTVDAGWLAGEKKVIIHAGGCSRRIPAYAPSGKVLTPIPRRGAGGYVRKSSTLLDEQLPLLRRIMEQAPEGMHTLIASGDVLIRASRVPHIPDADVVCFGMGRPPVQMQNHGVFAMRRDRPAELDFMLQKPAVAKMAELEATHILLMDIGLWLLSDKAVERLTTLATDDDGNIRFYDLYGAFGLGLGVSPAKPEPLLSDLSVAIAPIEEGQFLHFGTSRELISSTAALLGEKPNFVFNSAAKAPWIDKLDNIWIENAWVPDGWKLGGRNIITGTHIIGGYNSMHLAEGQCVDVVPTSNGWVLRPYGFNDKFSGSLASGDTMFLEQPVVRWMERRGITLGDFKHTADIQDAELFPVVSDRYEKYCLLQWFLAEEPELALTKVWRECRRLSANQISEEADLHRVFSTRSDSYESNLVDAMHDAMWQSREAEQKGRDGTAHSECAFTMLREGLLDNLLSARSLPRRDVADDQIVCAQSPVRADVAGGWTDTPPFSVYDGGRVVNLAFNINGQAPLHAYVRPLKDYHIVCRSIDLGATEVIADFDGLRQFQKVGSPFSIPKAALALAGFLPEFCGERHASLRRQLEHLGCGIEITTLAAVPAGSGLGTSSILAATVLGALSNFCALGWSKTEICSRTLALEQLLTTGGGWQDQYGGIFAGVKMLDGNRGFGQDVDITTLPDDIFKGAQAECHLMYYTGITRTAKQILVEIVNGMFVQEREHLAVLREMRDHVRNMAHAIKGGDFRSYGQLVLRSWELNCRLDSGTNPAKVQELCSRIDDLCLGYKLLGAGGGGYMYMVTKDAEAAMRLRRELTVNPLCATSRFVDMNISGSGLQVSRS